MPLQSALAILLLTVLVDPGVSFQIEAGEVREVRDLMTFSKFRSKILTFFSKFLALHSIYNVQSILIRHYFGATRQQKIKRRCMYGGSVYQYHIWYILHLQLDCKCIAIL